MWARTIQKAFLTPIFNYHYLSFLVFLRLFLSISVTIERDLCNLLAFLQIISEHLFKILFYRNFLLVKFMENAIKLMSDLRFWNILLLGPVVA